MISWAGVSFAAFPARSLFSFLCGRVCKRETKAHLLRVNRPDCNKTKNTKLPWELKLIPATATEDVLQPSWLWSTHKSSSRCCRWAKRRVAHVAISTHPLAASTFPPDAMTHPVVFCALGATIMSVSCQSNLSPLHCFPVYGLWRSTFLTPSFLVQAPPALQILTSGLFLCGFQVLHVGKQTEEPTLWDGVSLLPKRSP